MMMSGPQETASQIDAQIRALPERNTPTVRAVRRAYSRQLNQAEPEFVLDVARELRTAYGRWMAYEQAILLFSVDTPATLAGIVSAIVDDPVASSSTADPAGCLRVS